MIIVTGIHHGRLELGFESREPRSGFGFCPCEACDFKQVPEPLCLAVSAPVKQRY